MNNHSYRQDNNECELIVLLGVFDLLILSLVAITHHNFQSQPC
jgi:hypothetical protein